MKPSYSPVNRKSEPGEEPGEFQGEGMACQLQIPFAQRLSSRPFSSHLSSGTVRPGFDEPYIRHQLMTYHTLSHSHKSVAQRHSAAVVRIFQSSLVSRSDLLVMNTQTFWGTDQFTRAGGEVLAHILDMFQTGNWRRGPKLSPASRHSQSASSSGAAVSVHSRPQPGSEYH